MFRFADTDMRNLSSEIKPFNESIHKTLLASVPGLITGETTNPLDESLAASGRHRNLIPSHAFNVTTLFQPTIAFIDRAASVAPAGFESEPKTFGAVLEDFVVRVFLPQLDSRVTGSFQTAVSGYDAYQLDRSVTDTDKPPLKVCPFAKVQRLIPSRAFGSWPSFTACVKCCRQRHSIERTTADSSSGSLCNTTNNAAPVSKVRARVSGADVKSSSRNPPVSTRRCLRCGLSGKT